MPRDRSLTGTYTVDENTKTIHANIETSTFPNLVGAPNQRQIITSITADEMKFTNPRTPAGVTLDSCGSGRSNRPARVLLLANSQTLCLSFFARRVCQNVENRGGAIQVSLWDALGCRLWHDITADGEGRTDMSRTGTSRHTALRSSHVRFGGEPEMSGRTACLISTPSAWRSI